MLSINATLEGDKVVLTGLRDLERDLPYVLQRVLSKGAEMTHRESFDLLSGASEPSGGYPVPVVTGNLRRLLDWLRPGSNKGGFSAGKFEALVYDSAQYSRAIHDGLGSSAKFGARPFIKDGFERFNSGGNLAKIAAAEIEKEAHKKGFR